MSSKHHIEQEIKLTAPDADSLAGVMDDPLITRLLSDRDEELPSQSFRATYYDCPDWRLRERRWSLRTRYEGERHVGTLKRRFHIRSGYSACEEFEQPVNHEFKQVSSIPPGQIADTLLEVMPGTTPLLQRVKVNMTRQKRELVLGQTRLELATDMGYITANDRRIELFEVELELLQGDLHDPAVKTLADSLCRNHSLRASRLSKHQLGLACFTDWPEN